jgi:hypothetical protein
MPHADCYHLLLKAEYCFVSSKKRVFSRKERRTYKYKEFNGADMLTQDLSDENN